MSALRVTLVRSWAGRSDRQRKTVEGLGLYKLGDEKLLPDNKATEGMIRHVHHLVVWERVESAPDPKGRRSLAKRAPTRPS